MAACRHQAEQMDQTPDFLLLHSLAGGTGSGLGSRVLEQLRYDYPASYLAAACITPSSAGDTALQSINSTMALSFLQAYADVAMLFSNDSLLASPHTQPAVSSSSSTGRGGAHGAVPSRPGSSSSMLSAPVAGSPGRANAAQMGMKEMNTVVARRLVGALWPAGKVEVLGGASRIRDIVQVVAPHPGMKYVEVGFCSPHPTTPTPSLWAESIKLMGREFPRFHSHERLGPQRLVTASSTLLLARNYSEPAIPNPEAAGRLAESKLFPPPASLSSPAGVPPNVTLRCCQHPLPPRMVSCGSQRGKAAASAAEPALAAISNRCSVVPLLDRCVQRSVALCQAGAYLHWYERYGCSKDAILEAAGVVADTAEFYCLNFGLPLDALSGL